MKICKAIKLCRKLAKSALHDATIAASAATQRGALRSVKTLLEKFDDELRARCETASLRQAAAAMAGTGRGRRDDAAQQLERVADIATGYLGSRAKPAKKDEASAVAIVRALAWQIRSTQLNGASRRMKAETALQMG